MIPITVFILVYNASLYIDEAIRSILAQTYSSFELLVIDGCSTDDSYQKLQLWQQKDSRSIIAK